MVNPFDLLPLEREDILLLEARTSYQRKRIHQWAKQNRIFSTACTYYDFARNTMWKCRKCSYATFADTLVSLDSDETDPLWGCSNCYEWLRPDDRDLVKIVTTFNAVVIAPSEALIPRKHGIFIFGHFTNRSTPRPEDALLSPDNSIYGPSYGGVVKGRWDELKDRLNGIRYQ